MQVALRRGPFADTLEDGSVIFLYHFLFLLAEKCTHCHGREAIASLYFLAIGKVENILVQRKIRVFIVAIR